MDNKLKDIDIKTTPTTFLIKFCDLNKMKRDKKSYKNIVNYYIG